MPTLVNAKVTEVEDQLRQQFSTAVPFNHVVIDDFLEPAFARQLLDNFPAFDRDLAVDESGKVGAKCVHEDVRSLGDPYQALDDLVASRHFLDLIETITGIEGLVYDPFYYGGGTHENLSGQDLDLHIDFNYHPTSNLHRRLNLILFLNDHWMESWGGCLELCQDPKQPDSAKVSIVPQFNRLAMFATTEHSWHGFLRILEGDGPRSRKSFALYYYSHDRPAEELEQPHSTVYIDRPLPEDIRNNPNISRETLVELERLLSRRDQHIERLYQDIQRLMTELDTYQRSWVLRYVRRALRLTGEMLTKLNLR